MFRETVHSMFAPFCCFRVIAKVKILVTLSRQWLGLKKFAYKFDILYIIEVSASEACSVDEI